MCFMRVYGALGRIAERSYRVRTHRRDPRHNLSLLRTAAQNEGLAENSRPSLSQRAAPSEKIQIDVKKARLRNLNFRSTFQVMSPRPPLAEKS